MSKETIAAAARIVRKMLAKRGIRTGIIDTTAGVHQHQVDRILRRTKSYPMPGEYETGPDEEREDPK